MKMVQQSLSNLITKSQIIEGYRQIFDCYVSEPSILISPPKNVKEEQTKQRTVHGCYSKLVNKQKVLMRQLQEGQEQYAIMSNLFNSLIKTENGEYNPDKKRERRNPVDIVLKHTCKFKNCHKSYSSSDCLLRHIKVKHSSTKNEPPELFYDLHPEPNLTNLYFQMSSEVMEEKKTMIRDKTINDT